MGLDTGGGGGNDVATTDITIVSPGHPLAAGLTGTVKVLTDISKDGAFARFARCHVGGDGTAIATWTDSAGTVYDVLMVYEQGDELAQFPGDGSSIEAANIRIGIGFDERSFELWNDNAFLLLEAAINYPFPAPPPDLPSFRRGDCNDDGAVNITDGVCILNWLFGGDATPGCIAATNTNGEGATNITDATYLLNHLFSGGPAPVQPFPDCGPGTLPADEELGCANPPDCP